MDVMFNLYIQVESDDLQNIAQSVEADVAPWLVEKNTGAQLMSEREGEDYLSVGINIQVRKKAGLKEPLRFLYSVAKTHKCDFVLGVYDGDVKEDLCYFGHEEGKPDVFEVANYIGLY